MSFGVFLAVLGAAFLHALWNAIIKQGGSRLTAMLIATILQGAIAVVVACFHVLPRGEVWWWILFSGLFHSAYKFFLTYAYEQGDLSRVYPIARGAAPMVVLVFGAIALSDVIAGHEYAGVVVLGLGIILMAHGAFSNGESRRLVPFALGSALATAGYTLVDGLGARVSGNPISYVAWLFIIDTALYTLLNVLWHGPSVLRAGRRLWVRGGIAAAGSYGSYAIAVWAMTLAPLALVAALRETSILFAVLIGWLVMGERMDRMKGLAALLIVAGVVLTRI